MKPSELRLVPEDRYSLDNLVARFGMTEDEIALKALELLDDYRTEVRQGNRIALVNRQKGQSYGLYITPGPLSDESELRYALSVYTHTFTAYGKGFEAFSQRRGSHPAGESKFDLTKYYPAEKLK